jgi:hypothetical protein
VDLSFYTSWLAEEIRAEGYAHALLHVLAERGIDVPCVDRERITSCTDPELLDTWLTRALTATTVAEIFTEDDA